MELITSLRVSAVAFCAVSAVATSIFGAVQLTVHTQIVGGVSGQNYPGSTSGQTVGDSQFIVSDRTLPIILDREYHIAVDDRGKAKLDGSAEAFARIGRLGVSVSGSLEASRTDVLPSQSGHAQLTRIKALASWQDSIVINTRLPGRALVIESTLRFDGHVNAFADGVPSASADESYVKASASVFAKISATDALPSAPYFPYWAYAEQVMGFPQVLNEPSPVIAYQQLLVAGQPHSFGVTLEVEGKARADADGGISNQQTPSRAFAFLSGYFGHTLSWGGITSVRDAETGELIEDWTVTSESGVDYANPIPEPAALPLLALAALALRRRRHGH